MSAPKTDNEFLFYSKTNLPHTGWIHGCFICSAETAQTIAVDNNVYKLIVIIINENRWIIYYCEWLFNLLQLIGYQIDYKKYVESKYYDLVNQNFLYEPNANTIEFPHNLFNNRKKISYKNLNAFFTIFENIFTKNHLDNINYRMPIYFINFKKIILNTLQNL